MKTKSFFIYIFISIIFYTNFISAQEDDTTSQNFVKKNFSISGEIGTYGELYSMEGQQKRRPSSTGRLFFRPTLNLFGVIQIPFEFLLSTEGSSARQNINQFGINPKWDWGSLNAGDFSEEYSQYTLSGIKIRGGGINITPGNFRFSTAAGFTQRSVPGGAQDGSFKRFLVAAKLGYGNEENSFFDLIFVRAKDDVNSLQPNEKSITMISPNGNDILEIGSLQSIRWNSFGIDGAIKIELSRDGGNTFELLSDNQPNVGFYNWTVTGASTFQAIIKVISLSFPEVFDVSDLVFTITSGVDSYIASNLNELINPYAVTPQENLIIGTKGKISFIENKVSLEFDAGGSVYSRDLRASELNLDSANFPSFIKGIYKPRVGTNYDFALNSLLKLNFQSVNTTVGFKHIGPGYNSLGTAYLLNDIREYSIMNSLRFIGTAITVGYINQSDNLIDQKLYTTSRNIIMLGLNTMITQFWNSSFFANYLDMKNDSNNDSTKIKFGNFILSTNQSFIINPQGFLKNINLNYVFQTSDNQSYLIRNAKSFVHTLNIGFGLYPLQNLSTTLSAGFVNSHVFDTLKTFTHNYSLYIQHTGFSNKLINDLNLTSVFSEENTSFRATLGSRYRFSSADNIGVTLSFMKFNGSSISGGNFKEFLGSLNYSHTF